MIDQTEALTAVDVNSGRSTSQTGHNETIYQTNLEAVQEIARQLRLRDMGGIIVLDLIDMDSASDRRKIESAFEAALKLDKNRCKVSHISPLGLIEMTRKRTGETLNEQMDDACPYCSGTGRIPSAESLALNIHRDLRTRARDRGTEGSLVVCHPLVASTLIGDDGEELEKLEHDLQHAVFVRSRDDLHQERYTILPGKLEELDKRHPTLKKGQVAEVRVVRDPRIPAPAATGFVESGMLVHLTNGARYVGHVVRAKVLSTGRSHATAEVLGRGAGSTQTSGDTVPTAPEPAQPANAPRGRRRR